MLAAVVAFVFGVVAEVLLKAGRKVRFIGECTVTILRPWKWSFMPVFIRMKAIAPALLMACLTSNPALAGKADVIDASAARGAAGTFTFVVTIKSDDTGWEKYADKWEILAPDGTVLGTRVLLHPHETEQPLTRELSGVEIPASIKEVTIRAHDSVEGFGGTILKVNLPQ